jgi:ubiquinone/menaquinone biosynthesis C-methylase UbiE
LDTLEQDYMLGYSEREACRLEEQAAFLQDLTEEMLRRAGLQPGMRVLDVGCGVGDVSLLVARMVGPCGAVLGVDRAAASVGTARQRAIGARATNVQFIEADVQTFATEQTFDAVIGRVVLMYLPDPSAVLRRLRKYVRPGGFIAFQEIDISHASQVPPSALFSNVTRWVSAAFRAGGAEPEMGSKLAATFLRAGLPRPEMISMARAETGAQSRAYSYVADFVRSALPLIEQSCAASAEEIDIETLADRLRNDAVENERVTFLQRFVGAWSQLDGEAEP